MRNHRPPFIVKRQVSKNIYLKTYLAENPTLKIKISLLNTKISKWILGCRVKHRIKKLVNVTQVATVSHQIQI